MATDFVYDLKAKSLSSLVPPATAISLARSIVADLDGTWTKCSKYNKAQGISVQTYSRHLYGEKWSARKSVHDVPWEWFMSGLCEDHTKNELEYIHDFNSYKEVDGGESGWKGELLDLAHCDKCTQQGVIYRSHFPLQDGWYTLGPRDPSVALCQTT